MDPLIIFFVICQAFGAIMGACSAVWGELCYLAAVRDGHISRAERVHLDSLAHGLTYGMTLLLVASLGLVITAYVSGAAVQPALTSTYWSFIALALLVTTLAWALSRRHLSFALTTAAIFTGWWFLLYLALGRLPALTFGASVALFVIVTALFYAILHASRSVAIKRTVPGDAKL